MMYDKCPKCGCEELDYYEAEWKKFSDGVFMDCYGEPETLVVVCSECQYRMHDSSQVPMRKFLKEKDMWDEYREWKEERDTIEAL